ncbi:hypothetical protein BpHYR1_049440 [Brachionus plicatilis]|uniref:Uncharacterized protein n=1 Tax=Brachionus plicatilis TaxID=10195 RepID=A0A3M7P349_BRAPC|nr:hypothetical protein BpHYR1_049440 [Brachionus plicatilis]
MSVLIAINIIIEIVSFFSEDKRFVASSNPINISTISFNSAVSLTENRTNVAEIVQSNCLRSRE